MSKNTSSEIKLTPTAPAALPALKGLNLQVFVMIAAIVVIMLFFTGYRWRLPERTQYLQPAAADGHHRHPRRRHGVCDYFGRNRLVRWLDDGAAGRRCGDL